MSQSNTQTHVDQIHAEHVAFARRSSLAKIVGGETLCALATAMSVAPVIAIVDQSIFSSASGRESMLQCIVRETMQFVRSPLQIVRSPSVRWICAVYGLTYIAANVGETLYMRHVAHDDGHLSATNETATFKFVLTSATNVGMSVAKDRAFARMFGAVGHAAHAVPLSAMGLFAVRDCITVGASFTLVPTVTAWFESEFKLSHKRADTIAQLVTPCAAQIVNTPLYLAGLSLYNSPEHSLKQRANFMLHQYPKTVLARWGRIFPAFSIGGVLNKKLRRTLHGNGTPSAPAGSVQH